MVAAYKPNLCGLAVAYYVPGVLYDCRMGTPAPSISITICVFFNRNKRLKYAKTVHKIVYSSCSSEYDNNISHAKNTFSSLKMSY